MLKTAIHQDWTEELSQDVLEIHAGLSQQQKTISSKFFYDQAGSELFDAICELPEYYPTRTELGIMQSNIRELSQLIGQQASLIEFGSGSSLKTRTLLRHLDKLAAYVPVDISKEHLSLAAQQIRGQFPGIEVLPVVADFTKTFRLPNPEITPVRNIVYFPGSTIGNFTRNACLRLLDVMYQEAGAGGALLIGVDLQKDKSLLENAYNDSRGVTADFNLNVLRRLNKEFDATFDLGQFRHRAIYNEQAGRIEMYLDSQVKQSAFVDGKVFQFSAGESILTEHSHKYTLEGFTELALSAGFQVENVWTDSEQLFSVQYCIRIEK